MSLHDLEVDAQWKEERKRRKEAEKAEKEAAAKDDKSEAETTTLDGEIVDDSEFEDDSESDLSNALILLNDCVNMLTVLSDERIVVVSRYLQQEAKELLAEVSVFLDEYDMDELNDKEKQLYRYLP